MKYSVDLLVGENPNYGSDSAEDVQEEESPGGKRWHVENI